MGFFDFLDPSKILNGIGGGGSAEASKYLTDKQYEIADTVQRREDRLFNVWRTHYRRCEIELQRETCALPVFTLFPREQSGVARYDVQTAFWDTKRQIENAVLNNCGKLSCSTDNMVAMSRAGIMTWASNSVMRADEELLPVRRQQRYEELSRMAAFGHKVYFNSRGAEMAISIYGQAAAMALRQQNNTASALGYFLQRVVSYGDQAGWFGSQQQQSASLAMSSSARYDMGSDLSGQDSSATFSSNHLSLPDSSNTNPVQPQHDVSGGNGNPSPTNTYGNGSGYPN